MKYFNSSSGKIQGQVSNINKVHIYHTCMDINKPIIQWKSLQNEVQIIVIIWMANFVVFITKANNNCACIRERKKKCLTTTSIEHITTENILTNILYNWLTFAFFLTHPFFHSFFCDVKKICIRLNFLHNVIEACSSVEFDTWKLSRLLNSDTLNLFYLF